MVNSTSASTALNITRRRPNSNGHFPRSKASAFAVDDVADVVVAVAVAPGGGGGARRSGPGAVQRNGRERGRVNCGRWFAPFGWCGLMNDYIKICYKCYRAGPPNGARSPRYINSHSLKEKKDRNIRHGQKLERKIIPASTSSHLQTFEKLKSQTNNTKETKAAKRAKKPTLTDAALLTC